MTLTQGGDRGDLDYSQKQILLPHSTVTIPEFQLAIALNKIFLIQYNE